jgi:hypothetical protein
MLTEKLLSKLGEWQPTGTGRHSWSTDEDGWNIHLSADRADSLSCLIWELTLSRTDAAPADLTLKSWAEGIASRVEGLREDLKVYEVDAGANVAVLRSTEPNARGEALAYYEVKLHCVERAVVRRFNANKSKTGREQVAFALTHEVLAQLAEGIAG